MKSILHLFVRVPIFGVKSSTSFLFFLRLCRMLAYAECMAHLIYSFLSSRFLFLASFFILLNFIIIAVTDGKSKIFSLL